MKKVKRRTFSGSVCEQEVFSISERAARNIKAAEPRPRFATEEEREAHKLGIARRKHARQFNANYSPTSLYSTLTMDDEHEVHTFQEARRVRDLLFRRLKYHCPEARIHIYMGRGKSTQRIHLHMVSDGVPEELIREQWDAGSIVRIEHLREHNYYEGKDYGQDYTGLANYLFDHWTPEQGPGKRWKSTRNLVKPNKEEPRIALINYSEKRPPVAPKGYILVESRSTRYGYLYFKYVLEPPPRRRKKKKADEGRQFTAS